MNLVQENSDPEAVGRQEWLNAAYSLLIEQGVDKVRIATLTERVKSSRTAFYWYFSSRDALLETLIQIWQDKNTNSLIERIDAYAETINEAIFNMFDCWLDREIFDSDLDLAIRNWAASDRQVALKVEQADQERVEALIRMFQRFGFGQDAAFTRAHTVYYTQIGYISMMVQDEPGERLARMPAYAEVYTGQKPTQREITRFFSRHDNAPRLED